MKEKFDIILDENEEIKWCDGIYSKAYIMDTFGKTFLIGLFPATAVLMLGVPYGWLFLILSLLGVIPLWIGVSYFIFSIIVCLIFIVILNMNAKNTFFCITNKRVIKRSGAFNNKFIHYSLKNIGTIKVDGGIFDRKDNNPSASLTVTVKDYHNNTDGNSNPTVLNVKSLNNAYEAYKLLNNLTEGNNENIRIKVETDSE